ncbi:elongation factor 4 [bacterium (Candidatus Gribaldobacteria) CG_4_10_14_0_8_um_filter_33_9]|uniref:Elongation factor 4 n=1 Tax=bacterium (Candidatus Gribaldobacteria) CG_4_10_14_0_8_um_filter_33_9 TaxID=2014266 RepID=A0A2M7RP50_9BACT|nr:MAG: elongation factor 4 [bacterium (Candidatus Gribaldobacteria) CG_4_10_14_0_8_um_filter_33_9]
MKNIRNFCIIAHIDHGKSTLADRMLELTETIEKRKMKEQVLDKMELERERGITIKLQPVTMEYQGYILNLIDTPGHVDFTYEVSRSLAAVEGVILLVDASQGIQAQTLANLYLAIEQDLTIIPVVNKIDLSTANIEKTKDEIIKLIGCEENEIICASGKTGQGVEEILQAVVERIPWPAETDVLPLRAIIFDSTYDEYKGVVAYVRIVDGKIKKGNKIYLTFTGAEGEALDVGVFKPDYKSTEELKTGEIGYIITGFKQVSDCRVGDTITTISPLKRLDDFKPLPGYKEPKPMVFAGIFPQEGNDFIELKKAIEKLKLNDAALNYESEYSEALGLGFRCGFLGLLHLEIFQERLKREYDCDIIITIPSVAYHVDDAIVRTPQKLPEPNKIKKIEEPWVKLDIITPKEYIGNLMALTQDKRGIYKNTEYINEQRVILHYEMPMAGILTNFYDKIKSISSGFASINYEFLDYRKADVVKMDILVAEKMVEALSLIVYRDETFVRGKEIVNTLKEALPRQLFVLKLQAVVGGKVVAAERLSALRKDVTAKLYGGDVTRKKKLLEKQKKGKKKMLAMGVGTVKIPDNVFVKILKR